MPKGYAADCWGAAPQSRSAPYSCPSSGYPSKTHSLHAATQYQIHCAQAAPLSRDSDQQLPTRHPQAHPHSNPSRTVYRIHQDQYQDQHQDSRLEDTPSPEYTHQPLEYLPRAFSSVYPRAPTPHHSGHHCQPSPDTSRESIYSHSQSTYPPRRRQVVNQSQIDTYPASRSPRAHSPFKLSPSPSTWNDPDSANLVQSTLTDHRFSRSARPRQSPQHTSTAARSAGTNSRQAVLGFRPPTYADTNNRAQPTISGQALFAPPPAQYYHPVDSDTVRSGASHFNHNHRADTSQASNVAVSSQAKARESDCPTVSYCA